MTTNDTIPGPPHIQGAAAGRFAGTPGVGVPDWAALPVILAGTFMVTLDFFIVNVAIPTMQRSLHATTTEIQWTVAGYALAIAAGVITAGRLGDLYGRRRMYSIGLALFTLASLACGVAGTAAELVAARVAQGLAAALMTPQVLAIITTAFSGTRLGRAFTVYGLTLGIAAVFGQLIGGVLIRADVLNLDWRSCFLINLPIGALALALAPRVVPKSAGTHTAKLDLLGMVLVTLALVAVVLPLIQGQSLGWPWWTYVSFAIGALLLGTYGWYQRALTRRNGQPLIDLRMFTSRGFAVGIGTQLVFWCGQASFFLFLAIYLQDARQLTPLAAGVVFTAIGAGYLATSTSAGQLSARLGRHAVTIGVLLMAIALIAMQATVRSIGTAGAVAWLVPSLVVDGLGMGMALSPLASMALAYVPARLAGAGSGILSTAMQVGGALGIAVLGVVFYHALGHGSGIPAAFGNALICLAIIEVGVATLVQFLPRQVQQPSD
ncbi:MAG TPA: MFS transporter [Micromonosporaceae bacterium]|jgi:EmrB/QacA subfamily drug resistance transporter